MPELTTEQKRQRRILLRKAELLWKLVTTTSGVADLAEPMKRAEYHFDRLTRSQRTTVAVIVKQLDGGFREIDSQENNVKTESVSETDEKLVGAVVTPDEVIPPDYNKEEGE